MACPGVEGFPVLGWVCELAWQVAKSRSVPVLVIMAVKAGGQAGFGPTRACEVALCQLPLWNWVLASTPAGSTPRPALRHPPLPQHPLLLAGGPASCPLSS